VAAIRHGCNTGTSGQVKDQHVSHLRQVLVKTWSAGQQHVIVEATDKCISTFAVVSC